MDTDAYSKIKDQVKDELNNAVDSFFDSFTQRSNEHADTKIPTLSEIESIWGQLSLETRDLFSKMVGDAISQLDESEAIELKKANTDKRG